MTNRKPIHASEDSARVLQELMRLQNVATDSENSVHGRTQPIIAKVLATIAAGDYRVKDALLMKFNGTALESTGQTIQIRHVGEASVPVNSIVFPEPCSNLGMCFVKHGVSVAGTIPIYRYIRLVGQVAGETGDEDTNWTSTPQGLTCQINFQDAPTYSVPETGVGHWVRNMYPLRFKLDSFGDGFWGPMTTGPANSGFNPVTRFQLINNNIGLSSTTLGPDSHMWPMNLRMINFPYPFNYIWRDLSAPSFQCSVAATHYRILIDEVDVTGVLEYPSPVEFVNNPSTWRGRGGQSANVTLPEFAHESKSLWIDYWVTVDAFRGDVGIYMGLRDCCWAEFSAIFRPAELGYSDPNVNRGTTDKYEFEFDAYGIDGVSSIVGETQTGWTFSESMYGLSLAKAGIGSLNMNWQKEVPEILYGLNAQTGIPAGAGGLMRYLPVDSGDYDGVVFGNGHRVRPGVWDSQGTTVFAAVGRSVFNYYITKDAANYPVDYFANFPSTITVTKV